MPSGSINRLCNLDPRGFVKYLAELYTEVFRGIVDLLLFWAPDQHR